MPYQFGAKFCIKGALSWHFHYFSAKTIQKSFFLTLTRAKNIALKFRTKTSISFLQKESSRVHFRFCLKDGSKNCKKLRLNLLKCYPSPSLPSATTEGSRQPQCSYLVFNKQTSSRLFKFSLM